MLADPDGLAGFALDRDVMVRGFVLRVDAQSRSGIQNKGSAGHGADHMPPYRIPTNDSLAA